MYDTIKFRYKYNENEYHILKASIISLGKTIETRYQNTDTTTITVHYKSWRFTLTPNYLICTGSLPQLLYSTNLINFTIDNTRTAITELNNIVGVNIQNAEITRLDFGYNIIVNHPAPQYLKLFGHKSYCRPSTEGSETLRFTGKNQEFTFYDKVTQLKNKGEQIPDEYVGKHVLRYEMKLMQGVAKKLGYDVVTLVDLAKDSVYQTVKNKWYDEYASIDKLSFDIPDIGNSAKQYKDYLLVENIERRGLSSIYSEVDAIFKSNYKVKSRIKKGLKRLTSNGKALVTNVAAAELEDKIAEIMEVVY